VDQVRPVLLQSLLEPINDAHVPTQAASDEVDGNATSGELVKVEIRCVKVDDVAFDV